MLIENGKTLHHPGQKVARQKARNKGATE